MSLSHSSYNESPTPFPSVFGVGPTLSDAQLPENASTHGNSPTPPLMMYPPATRHSEHTGTLATCPLPGPSGNIGTMSPVIWEFQPEQETFLQGPLVQDFPPYELAFLTDSFPPGQHVAYSAPSSYERMLRGRKCKAAFEVCPQRVNSLASPSYVPSL
jgi:hypothetical protein